MFTQSTKHECPKQAMLEDGTFSWDAPQSQELVEFELIVSGTFTGGLVVPPHCWAQVGNELTVLFKQGQLLFVDLSGVERAFVIES